MKEKIDNENSHITLNIYNIQKDTNKNKGQSETSFQTNNSFTNTVEYFNNGISNEFPDNLRTAEGRENYIAIKKEILTNKGFSKSVNVYNNNNYAQPVSIMQRPNIIMSNNNSDFSKEEYEKESCCRKCKEKWYPGNCSIKRAIITTFIIILLIIIITLIGGGYKNN